MKKYALAVIFLTLILSSCVTIKHIPIDVYQPARVTFPPEVVNVAIVDNTPHADDELIAIDGRNIQQISLDTAKVIFVDSLSAYLDREDFFGEVVAYPVLTGEDSDKPLPLTISKIRRISQDMGVNAIISLDNFNISGKLYKVTDPFVGGVTQEMSLGMMVKLSTYSSEGDQFSEPIILSDTLYWSELMAEYPYFQQLPSFNEATQEMAMLAAESLVKQFTPYWETQTRFYFSNSKTDKLVESFKWDEALTVWMSEFENENKETKKAYLAHNIALAYECLGNISEAKRWIDIAMELLPNVKVEEAKARITYYDIILEQRVAALEKLQMQIGPVNVLTDEPDSNL